MPELKALARECRMRNYSQLTKAELIELIRNDQRNTNPPLQSWEPSMPQRALNRPPRPTRPPPPPPIQTWEPTDDRLRPELEAPLTKRQVKHRRNKDSKLNKKFKNLEVEIDNLKSQMDSLKDKITKASESTNARFKRKKIRSMKRDFDKINEKLKESEKKLESVAPRVPRDPLHGGPLKLHPLNRNKHVEKKIAEINKKIRRARKKKNKEALIAKREALKAELNWNPEVRLIEGAFGGAYSKYRIDGRPMDPDTCLNRIRRSLIDLIRKESRGRSVRYQTSMWIRFRKDKDLVELVFNSLMTNIYNLNNLDEIVLEMINNMKYQIENPTLLNSRFIFELLYMDINIHQLNLTRGSSYLPLPDWLARKKAIINPKNEDQECFKWAVIVALEFQNIESYPGEYQTLSNFPINMIGLG